MTSRFTIVGLGEALFDVFPSGAILGGAPLNTAVHAHQLAASQQGRAVVVSRVGQDALGRRAEDELKQRGMSTEFLQTDPDHTTGEVFVDVDHQGQPTYEIAQDAAWDWVQYDPDVDDLAKRCDAVCFGSLAQRNGQTRNTIYRFIDACRASCVRMFDVNLRQNFYDRAILRRSCEIASVVKLNDQELPVVAATLGLTGDTPEAQIASLLRTFKLRLVVYTRGTQGTVLQTATDRLESEPVSYPSADGADSVGAGDACGAAILVGMVLRRPLPKVLELANHTGAYVASQPGGTPALPDSILAMLR